MADELVKADPEKGRSGGLRLTRIKGERIDIREIPPDFPTTNAEQPECDFLCQLAEEDGA